MHAIVRDLERTSEVSIQFSAAWKRKSEKLGFNFKSYFWKIYFNYV